MKKKQLFGLILAVLVALLIPNNINAKEAKVTCQYQYQDKELVYIINDEVELPFVDGENNWYHEENFKNNYLVSAKENDKSYICPTITVEETNIFTTIFNNPKQDDECNGKCTTLSAVKYDSNKNVSVKKAVDTTAISSVGIYNEDKYFIPYIRLLDDGTKEWSVDGLNYVSVNKSIYKMYKNNKLEIKISDSLIENSTSVYRNVKKEKDTYIYLLSNNKEAGYDLVDGQETNARAYHAAYGDPDMDEWLEDYNQNQNCTGDNSILGSVNDPNSVAYFLQIIFNWIKLIGPFIVVVMSGIDFAKVIVMGDDDGMKKAQSKLIIRLILAASLFFLPDLIGALLELFNITSSGICGLQ